MEKLLKTSHQLIGEDVEFLRFWDYRLVDIANVREFYIVGSAFRWVITDGDIISYTAKNTLLSEVVDSWLSVDPKSRFVYDTKQTDGSVSTQESLTEVKKRCPDFKAERKERPGLFRRMYNRICELSQ